MTSPHTLPHRPAAGRCTAGLRRLAGLLALPALLAATAAPAQDLSLSGFATLGWSQSNRDFRYLNRVDDGGTLERDSLLGLQADWRIAPAWSATLQVTASPSPFQDHAWTVRPTWAFVAWRPADEWLLRLGRMRAPIYLHSETLYVGQTHDFARLPVEMYALAPANDFDGLYVTRTWATGAGPGDELSADAFVGRRHTDARVWLRDGLPPMLPAGANRFGSSTRLGGLALSWRRANVLLRGSAFHTSTAPDAGRGLPVDYPFVALGPGIGFYQVNDSLPGPGPTLTPRVRNTLVSLGTEVQFGDGWRLAAEYMLNRQHDTDFGIGSTARYVALSRRIGRWTPYAVAGEMDSPLASFDWYRKLTANPLPAQIPGAAMINAAQRVSAETIFLAQQRSVAVGTSYALTPNIKLKGEWMHTRIGQASRLVDTPPGRPTLRDTSVDVWSVNVNVAF